MGSIFEEVKAAVSGRGRVLTPADQQPYYGRPYQAGEDTQSFYVVNGVNLTEQLSFVPRSVIVDNNTSAWLLVPDATTDGLGRFVGPGQPAAFPLFGTTHRAQIVWQAPANRSQPPAIAAERAVITFSASPVPLGFGQAVAATQNRWGLFNSAAQGVKASATRAGSPGVTHVLDAVVMSYVQEATTVGVKSGGIIDDVSGGSIAMGKLFDTDGVAGHVNEWIESPLGFRGTAGNAMTIEFSSGQAGYQQSVSGLGYDL